MEEDEEEIVWMPLDKLDVSQKAAIIRKLPVLFGCKHFGYYHCCNANTCEGCEFFDYFMSY